jgi:hypothetical protein
MTRGGDTARIRATWRGRRRSAASWRESLALIAVSDSARSCVVCESQRSAQLTVPRQSQRVALREKRPDTAVTAESAWWSSFAVRADGTRRSAPTARRRTSSRASGSAMASSSQVRSRADRKTHMLSVPSSSRLEAAQPADGLRDFFTALSCTLGGVADSQLGRTGRYVPSPSRRYPRLGALITAPAGWSLQRRISGTAEAETTRHRPAADRKRRPRAMFLCIPRTDGTTAALTIGLPDLPDFDGDDPKPQAR